MLVLAAEDGLEGPAVFGALWALVCFFQLPFFSGLALISLYEREGCK